MSSGKGPTGTPSSGPVVRCGHLKKLKTLKKKYFVLRGEAPGCFACLEYYDSKKKFENKQPPKRSILLHSCFNINKRGDTKHKHVIALYTKDECFCLILDNEKELDEWLKAMLRLQSGDVPDGEQPRPTFEHVWQVTMQRKGLGARKNIHGPYRLCLTDQTLSLVKIGAQDHTDSIEFSLNYIRRCGFADDIFYIEVGRSAVTGDGEFWMAVEDNNIALNMYDVITNAMKNSKSSKDEVGPRQRMRSSSANEASKPISVLQRRHTGQKLHGFSPLEEQKTHKEQVEPMQEQTVTSSAPTQSSQSRSTSSTNTVTGATGRDRCDSLPSRARTTSEGQPTVVTSSHPRATHIISHVPVSRPHSMCGRGLSPPIASMPISPASDVCSSDSAGSSPSMDDCGESIMEEGTVLRYGHSLTPDEPPVILDKKADDYALWSTSHPHLKYSLNFKSHSPSQSSYGEMYSPCGSSPGRGGAYMAMSPATTIHSHSRGSSLVEESNVDGYVPMGPVGDDGYVDMDPINSHNGHFPDDMSQNDGSSCSVTSGTPSTDLRFSEYHLDKVTSFLAPGEDLQARPTRAYSVGSRPEQANRHRKNRLDITPQDANRVRAFSVGSRSKRPEIGRRANVTAPLLVGSDSSNSNKSNSAPLLSSSWGHNSGCSGTSDRMEDLMELDFTRPSIPTTLSSPPSSCSQSQSQSQSQSYSYSTATDTSSYVDMSPGQPPPVSTTAPYVDMSGVNKINRNNNNNTITANHNHSHMHIPLAFTHKPVITTLKPVEEAEGPYMKMDGGMTEDWTHSETSPQQVSSPMQEDTCQTNGPPGSTRTAPVDLPQPRQPPEGYVEMSFKTRPSLEQSYINMSMGANNRNNRKTRTGNRKDKSRSQPIAIQAAGKPSKSLPSFLPLNGSPTSESLASTPASPPRTTPTGSSATIFPFSLNSPQSPIKPFTNRNKNTDNVDVDVDVDVDVEIEIDIDMSKRSENNDYAVMEPARRICACSIPLAAETDDLSSSRTSSEKLSNSINRNSRLVSIGLEHGISINATNPLTKKLSDLAVSKPRLVTASPTTSPTLTGFKPSKPSSPKFIDETPTSTPRSTPTPTSTPMPCPLDSEDYEKLQPGATILHYASLDLPEVGNPPPLSPTSTQEGFTYAEIDFERLKRK